MSLPHFDPQATLFSTAALTGQLFPPSDRYRIFATQVYPRLAAARPALAAAYCLDNGRPGIEPVLLTAVTLMQFLEGVPDREAVEMLRYHAGWNLALNRAWGEALFHPTVLVYFRERLITHRQSAVAFEQVLEGLIEAGLLSRRCRQRLDSTFIAGLVSRMSRLECVRESVRLALKELESSAADFGKPAFWSELWERYVEQKMDYRATVEVLKQKMDQAGADGLRLLAWVKTLSEKTLAEGPQVAVLERVLGEQFEVTAGQRPVQRAASPAGAVQNPHEPQATWAAKGQGKHRKETVGYKVQVAESVGEEALEKGEPTRSFLTAMATQGATASDEAGLEAVEREEAAMGLEKPPAWHVDGAYVSGAKLAAMAAEGRELIGPAQPAPKKPGQFSAEDFQVSVESLRAVCPAGKDNTQCSRLQDGQDGHVEYRFEWSWQCWDCPLRERCVGKGQKHRTLTVGEHHSHLQARRQEQRTEAFAKQCRRRNAVEGTQSELVRGHGLRQARYRGREKVALQNYFIGAACNVKRWINRTIWEMQRAMKGAKVSLESG
jgi:hypothetical protein